MPRYRLIPHTADMGAWLYGASPEEIFVNAAAVMGVFMTERPPARSEKTVKVELEGQDRADLLVRWLNEILYLFQVRGLVPVEARVEKLSGNTLNATLDAATYRLEEHGAGTDIKAATYHRVEIKPHRSGWRARVFFDL